MLSVFPCAAMMWSLKVDIKPRIQIREKFPKSGVCALLHPCALCCTASVCLLSFLPLAVGQRPLPSSSPAVRHRNDCPSGGWCSTNTLCFPKVILESWAAKQIFLPGVFGEKLIEKMEKQPCVRSDDFCNCSTCYLNLITFANVTWIRAVVF